LYEKFEALTEEKRLRIINSALSEFSKKRFDAASTDEVAKNAGISKGALFSYFGSKNKLYIYVYRYAYNVLSEELWPKLDFSCPDLFLRIKQATIAKMKVFYKYPAIFDFFINVAADQANSEIQTALQKEISGQKKDAYDKLMSDIDYGDIKDEFDKNQVVCVILWTIDGFGNMISEQIKDRTLEPEDFSAWMADFDKYIETLKKAFCKEEYINGVRD